MSSISSKLCRGGIELEEEAEGIWEYVNDLVLRPGVAGGLLGVGEHL